MAAAATVVLKHGDDEAGETQTSSRGPFDFFQPSVGALMLEDMLGTAAGAGYWVKVDVEAKEEL